MHRRFLQLRAFSLFELMVVVGVLVLLLAIIVPLVQRARDMANATTCLSRLKQWGGAFQMYANDYRGYLPHEGASGSNTQTDAWYNVLPPYVNMLPYGQVYTGAVLGPPLYGYANNSIWYCPVLIAAGSKNASSGKNSFHYAMNDVLNGATSFRDLNNKYNLLRNNSSVTPRQPDCTVLVVEPQDNVPCVSPSASSGLALTRHLGTSLNFMFVDGHVETLRGSGSGACARFHQRVVDIIKPNAYLGAVCKLTAAEGHKTKDERHKEWRYQLMLNL